MPQIIRSFSIFNSCFSLFGTIKLIPAPKTEAKPKEINENILILPFGA